MLWRCKRGPNRTIIHSGFDGQIKSDRNRREPPDWLLAYKMEVEALAPDELDARVGVEPAAQTARAP